MLASIPLCYDADRPKSTLSSRSPATRKKVFFYVIYLRPELNKFLNSNCNAQVTYIYFPARSQVVNL